MLNPVWEHEIHGKAAAVTTKGWPAYLQNGDLMVTKERSPHWYCTDTWGQEAKRDLFALEAYLIYIKSLGGVLNSI